MRGELIAESPGNGKAVGSPRKFMLSDKCPAEPGEFLAPISAIGARSFLGNCSETEYLIFWPYLKSGLTLFAFVTLFFIFGKYDKNDENDGRKKNESTGHFRNRYCCKNDTTFLPELFLKASTPAV